MRYLSSTALFLMLIISTLTASGSRGNLDRTFSGDGKLTDWTGYATGVVSQPDGKIVVAIGPDFSAARYNSDGSRDTYFGNDGLASASFGSEDASVFGIAIQSDGKIVVVGYVCPCDDWGNAGFAVARFDPDGSLDLSFDGDGKVTTVIGGRATGYSVTLQPDNKIIVAGWSWESSPPYMKDHFAVARYKPDGSLDTTFGGDGTVTTSICENCNDEAFAVAVQPDGKIIAVGGGFDGTSSAKFEVVRFNVNGSLDDTFDSDGRLTTAFGIGQVASAVAIQSNGKIVAGGVRLDGPEFALARYNTNGSLDTSFDSDGKVTTMLSVSGSGVSSLAIESDENILALGSISTGFDGNSSDFAIVRYNRDGSLDRTYGGGGIASVDFDDPNDAAFGMALDNAGRALVVGQAGQNIAIARLLPGPLPTRYDFDGDRKADVSVYRDGSWYVYGSLDGFMAASWGNATDKVTAADFDGDGKTDYSVFRDGTWLTYQSSGSVSQVSWGAAGDVPVPADYDGDGRADQAVFRQGTWWIYRSTDGPIGIQWGVATDIPVPGDYDGDGKADVAIVRNGTWWIYQTTAGPAGISWGNATDKAVPADYDGDGRTDVAIVRDGTWWIYQSTLGVTGIAWGNGTDIPVPADYDGDGRADVAVFRGGTWWIYQSTLGATGVSWGAASDIPIPRWVS